MQGSEAKKNPGTGGPHRAVFLDHIDLTSKLKIKTIIVLLSGNSERFVSRKIERCRVQRPKKNPGTGGPHRVPRPHRSHFKAQDQDYYCPVKWKF